MTVSSSRSVGHVTSPPEQRGQRPASAARWNRQLHPGQYRSRETESAGSTLRSLLFDGSDTRRTSFGLMAQFSHGPSFRCRHALLAGLTHSENPVTFQSSGHGRSTIALSWKANLAGGHPRGDRTSRTSLKTGWWRVVGQHSQDEDEAHRGFGATSRTPWLGHCVVDRTPEGNGPREGLRISRDSVRPMRNI